MSIVSSEPDSGLGEGDQPEDIQDADFGSDDRWFLLRAAAGNETSVSEQVSVRRDRRR